MDIKEILSRCDHTLLRVDCTADEIRALCDDAIRYGCASVCIPPAHVAGAKRYVGDRLKICTVIGFPNGYSTPVVKAFVWWAYCQFRPKWKPSGRKATPAGLLYTPSRLMAASRAGLRRKSMLWFVLVRMPPAFAVVATASRRLVRVFFVFIP